MDFKYTGLNYLSALFFDAIYLLIFDRYLLI